VVVPYERAIEARLSPLRTVYVVPTVGGGVGEADGVAEGLAVDEAPGGVDGDAFELGVCRGLAAGRSAVDGDGDGDGEAVVAVPHAPSRTIVARALASRAEGRIGLVGVVAEV